MSFTNEQKKMEDQQPAEQEIYYCTGCGTKLTKYDERCPNCERKNPYYIYR